LTPATESPQNTPRWVWITLALVLLVTAGLRLRLLDVPLERDEGEYAYAAQLMLRGAAPYAQLYSMKAPGIYAAYAVTISIFGQTHTAIHFGLLLVNLASVTLLFLLVARLFQPATAIVAATAFAFLTLSRLVHGAVANAEHFVLLFVVGGFLALHAGTLVHRGRYWFLSGVLFGIAITMKQHGAAFALLAAACAYAVDPLHRSIERGTSSRHHSAFVAGVTLPLMLTVLVLVRAEAFRDFWFWTFVYGWEYAAGQSIAAGWRVFSAQAWAMVSTDPLLWLLALMGGVAVWKGGPLRWPVFGFLVAGSAATSVGFYFREHYFLYLIPVVATLIGVGAVDLSARVGTRVGSLRQAAAPMVFVVMAMMPGIAKEGSYLLTLDPLDVSRLVYGDNPFPEARIVGERIRDISEPEDTILVFGSEPELFFHARRRSATGHVYMYPMMETHAYANEMQLQYIQEAEAAAPEFIVVVNHEMSWLRGEESSTRVFEWLGQYAGMNYARVGIAEIRHPRPTVYRFGEPARTHELKSPHFLALYRRRG
jgi:hypothetical protein